MKVICENTNCNHEFEPKIKEKYLGAMISETYIRFPHCNTKYLIKLDNRLTRKLQRNIETIKEALNGNLTIAMKRALNVALTENINVHKSAMNKLMGGNMNGNTK